MKLRSHKESRKGDTVTIDATWTARNRQSAAVWLGQLKGTDGHPVDPAEAAKPLIQADVVDVNGITNGIAEIAWKRGWRPTGFANALQTLVMNFGKSGMPAASAPTTPSGEVDRSRH